jgi:hypothetical protein
MHKWIQHDGHSRIDALAVLRARGGHVWTRVDVHERTTDAAEALRRRMSPKIRVSSSNDSCGVRSLSRSVGRRRIFQRSATMSYTVHFRLPVSVRSVWWHALTEKCRLNCQNSVGLWPSNMSRATTEVDNFDKHATPIWDSEQGGKHCPHMPLRMDWFRAHDSIRRHTGVSLLRNVGFQS